MVNLRVIKKILKEEGIVNLGTQSLLLVTGKIHLKGKNVYHTIMKIFRQPEMGVMNPGKVYIVICIDAEGPNKYNKYRDWDNILSNFKKFSSSYPYIKLNFFVADWIDTVNDIYTANGHHKIFDKYKKFKHIYWHYHHPPDGQVDNVLDWEGKPYYEEIINRKIIDRKYFPTLFRAGHTFEGKKARKWLRRWIPFDISNMAPYRFWRGYPESWEPFKEGRRTIFRSLNAEDPKVANLRETDYAFMKASEGSDILISFFTHDYKDFTRYISYIDKLIKCSAAKYLSVDYKYTNGLHAIRKILSQKEFKSLHLNVTKKHKSKLIITSNRPIYQRHPYVVLKRKGHYIHIEDIKKIDKTTWEISIKQKFDKIGVAISDKFGYSAVRIIGDKL